jgi:bifunctional UDP-N-acetylglucosamine pyrophosphorylase/glucosamine-1-phosphate N-acetyltransferase
MPGKPGKDDLALLILAAGKGTRMRSRLPKVLHPVCGRPILRHQILAAREAGAARVVVVVGEEGPAISAALADEGVEFVRQEQALGTAHAALQARAALAGHRGPVLVMYGDHPLYRAETFARLIERWRTTGADLVVHTARFPEPRGYGRVVRGPDGGIERIVEERDASAEVRAIHEINLGNYVARADFLFGALARVKNHNVKGEYYLTDVVELALEDGLRVETETIDDWEEALGINTRADLAKAEAAMRRRIAERWMLEGVTFVDPERSYVDADVELAMDVVLEPGCVLRGRTRVGAGSRIGAGAVVDDSTLGADTHVKPHCWIESSRLGERCVVGPSAHLRPGSELADEVRIGNYVEVKNARIGRGTKADHLSYIGDADVGAGVTFACGAVVVNYDGVAKHRTTIGDGAFVGCNANLIAPITVEAGAFVAAGSTITLPVPGGALAVARAKQRNVEGWMERRRKSRKPGHE